MDSSRAAAIAPRAEGTDRTQEAGFLPGRVRMPANVASGDLTPPPDRPSEPAESLPPRLWRVVDRDGSTCDLPLAAGPQAPREETTAERDEGDAIGRDGAPDERWSEAKGSLSDLGFEEAAVKSRQWVAGFSPPSVKREAGIPRSEAPPRLPENGKSIDRSALPARRIPRWRRSGIGTCLRHPNSAHTGGRNAAHR